MRPRAARRRPIRLRLTLVYSGLFLLAGVALLAVTYGLVAQSLQTGAAAAVSMRILAVAGPATRLAHTASPCTRGRSRSSTMTSYAVNAVTSIAASPS